MQLGQVLAINANIVHASAGLRAKKSQTSQRGQYTYSAGSITHSDKRLPIFFPLFSFSSFFKRSTAYQVEKITSFYSQVLQFEQAAGRARVAK